ncbi:Thiolase, N-terminal domain-containing protein [Lipomyces orientalis]|uniref:Thiolase, N-terminal domain-containing protein n=1 Tax=Lipomyces orientalis TaxID=1233043 RepID=A0ACC3THG8_9ASCO
MFSRSGLAFLKSPSICQLRRSIHVSARVSLPGDDVYIVSAARTPVGKFNGALKSLTAPQLGIRAVTAAVERAGITDKSEVCQAYLGEVLQAGTGQSPARQVVMGAGFPVSTDATTINKVCASGLKAVMMATQNIQTGVADVMVAGGMESMSNVPYYLPRNQLYGHFQAADGIIKDGLWDVYGNIHMGNCAENTAKNYGLSREDQDNYAKESYRRAIYAQENGLFAEEIVPIEITSRGNTIAVAEDEEPRSVNLDKLPMLRPVFDQKGTVTAGNSSPINDGASAVVLASKSKFEKSNYNLPLARIVSYADAATDPIDFTIAPSLSVPLALKRAGLEIKDIAKYELNEAFAAVALANMQIMGLDPEKVNVKGGAVALGHPIGSSGSRILVTLIYSLKPGEFGVAGICNGGGASSAVVIERL